MTDKEKLVKIKSLADKMYYAAFNMTTDASLLRKAMKEYHQFIIHEYYYCKEEPVRRTSADIESAMQEVEEKSKVFTETHKGECADEILAQMRCEEPVSIWHNASEEPDQSKDLCAVYSNGKFDFFEHVEGKSYNNYWTAVNQARTEKGILLDKWAYLEDLLKHDNSCNLGKNLQEEPVSEDLEEEINRYIEPLSPEDIKAAPFCSIEDCARHFAKWQEKKDQSIIELAEDHAMLAGMEKMKEQMMAKAGNGRVDSVSNRQTRAHITVAFDSPRDIEVLDRLKVIVIKED